MGEVRKTKAQRHRERRKRAQALYVLKQVVDDTRSTISEQKSSMKRPLTRGRIIGRTDIGGTSRKPEDG